MNLLVIGASGFSGRHLLARARAEGGAVWAGDLQPADGAARFDLTRDRLADAVPASFFQQGGPPWAVVAAGITKIDACARDPEGTRRVNVAGTLRVMEEAAALGARPVCLTSSAVYDGRAGYYAEADVPAPLNEYGRQKAAVDAYCRERHPDWLLLRLDKVVGDDPAEPHLFAEWRGWLEAGRPIACVAGQVLSSTHVDDVARAVLEGCRRGLTGLYHAANSEFFSREELARQFLRIAGWPGEIVSRPSAAMGFSEPRADKTYLDGSRFAAATGLRFTSMRETIGCFAERARAAAGRGRERGMVLR